MGEPSRAFCVHHPTTRARRKCFHCYSPICPACQVKALGHIFCSNACLGKHRFQERRERIREFFLRLWLRERRFERTLERWTGGSLARALSLVLLLFLLYQTILLAKAVRDMPAPRISAGQPLAAPTLDVVHDGSHVTVSGNATGFSMAVLIADGRERDFCRVREGRFSFTFEPGKEDKSLQVQIYGDNVPVLYTRAYPIEPPVAAPVISPPPPVSAQPPKTLPAAPAPARPASAAAAVPASNTAAAPAVPSQKTSATASSPSALLAMDMNRGSPANRMVAITFDGGSHGNAGQAILDVLAKRRIKATFFLTGEFMERFGEITRRIAREGHEVGNHMYSHPHLTTFGKNLRQETLPGITREFVINELRKNEELFTSLTGSRMAPLWRAPYGEQNEAIRRWAAQAGYRHVSWTFDSKTRRSLDGLDWVADRRSELYLSSDQIVQKILSFDRETEIGLSGGIVLLHLGSERNVDPFHPKLGQLLDGLEKKGYRMGLVSEMLAGAGGGAV